MHYLKLSDPLSTSYLLQEAKKIGYVPEEVEYAIHHYDEYEGKFKTPLDFLHFEWHERKKMVREHIGQYVEERGLQDVGVPSWIEARDCLVECGGSMIEAIALCAQRREEKVSNIFLSHNKAIVLLSTKPLEQCAMSTL